MCGVQIVTIEYYILSEKYHNVQVTWLHSSAVLRYSERTHRDYISVLVQGNLGSWDFKSKRQQGVFCPEGMCRAHMFALAVTEQLETWPEQARHRQWVSTCLPPIHNGLIWHPVCMKWSSICELWGIHICWWLCCFIWLCRWCPAHECLNVVDSSIVCSHRLPWNSTIIVRIQIYSALMKVFVYVHQSFVKDEFRWGRAGTF